MDKAFDLEIKPEWAGMEVHQLDNELIDYIKEWFDVEDVYEDLTKEQADEIQAYAYEHEDDDGFDDIYYNLINLYEDILCELGYGEDE